MKMTFKTTNDLIEWIYTMHLQNTNGRETENEMFRLGIENCIQELDELNLFKLNTESEINEFCTCKNANSKRNGCCRICGGEIKN